MNEDQSSVGDAIAAALARAEELRRNSERPPRVRILTAFDEDWPGLTIHASIRSLSAAELRAQKGLGFRCIPWEELDARAGELVGMVDAAVGEVTLAVKSASPATRPSRAGTDDEIDTFNALVDELAATFSGAALAAINSRENVRRLPRGMGSEAAMVAALRLASMAAFTANVGQGDLQDELRLAFGRVLEKTGGLEQPSEARGLN